MTQFDDFGLAEPLLRAVAAEGYRTPTPIQSKVIPAMLDQRDVVGIAQTGTGKTAAFVLPILDRIATQRQRPAKRCCHALIIAPTRELAGQISDSIKTYGKHVRPSVTLIVGGTKYEPQIRALNRGTDIIVATPGRLLDHLSSNAVRLDETSCIVLDEADQMLDLGFLPAIRDLMQALPEQRQTVLLSATMPKPIRALTKDFLVDPAEIAVAESARPVAKIDQRVIHLDRAAKKDVLIDLLSGDDAARAIVFTRTKRGADRVHGHLEKAGLSCAAIHGDKNQNQRQRSLHAFRTGRARVLVATDVAARGIDVDDVSLVVNFELPNIAEAYVHRIGRTARAGKRGIAISLCDSSERGYLRGIERLTGQKISNQKSNIDSRVLNRELPNRSESTKVSPQSDSTMEKPATNGPATPKQPSRKRRGFHGGEQAPKRTRRRSKREASTQDHHSTPAAHKRHRRTGDVRTAKAPKARPGARSSAKVG